jgi:hypothetical protein
VSQVVGIYTLAEHCVRDGHDGLVRGWVVSRHCDNVKVHLVDVNLTVAVFAQEKVDIVQGLSRLYHPRGGLLGAGVGPLLRDDMDVVGHHLVITLVGAAGAAGHADQGRAGQEVVARPLLKGAGVVVGLVEEDGVGHAGNERAMGRLQEGTDRLAAKPLNNENKLEDAQ